MQQAAGCMCGDLCTPPHKSLECACCCDSIRFNCHADHAGRQQNKCIRVAQAPGGRSRWQGGAGGAPASAGARALRRPASAQAPANAAAVSGMPRRRSSRLAVRSAPPAARTPSARHSPPSAWPRAVRGQWYFNPKKDYTILYFRPGMHVTLAWMRHGASRVQQAPHKPPPASFPHMHAWRRAGSCAKQTKAFQPALDPDCLQAHPARLPPPPPPAAGRRLEAGRQHARLVDVQGPALQRGGLLVSGQRTRGQRGGVAPQARLLQRGHRLVRQACAAWRSVSSASAASRYLDLLEDKGAK